MRKEWDLVNQLKKKRLAKIKGWHTTGIHFVRKRVAKKADIDDNPVEKISRQLVDGVLFTA